MNTQQVRIERDLVFQGNASHTGNVKGRFSFQNKIVYYDDFTGKAIDSTNDYTVAAVNSGTATVTVPHCLTLTTGNADNDDIDVAMGVEWYGSLNACMEARFRIDDVDTSAINVGFTEATGTAADTIPMTVSGTTLTSTAVEFAGFLWDADATTTAAYVLGVSVKNNANGALISSAVAATDAKWFTCRVELQDNGTTTNAVFYLNTLGREIDPATDLIGVELDAVTRTTALCPYIGLINHPGVSETFDVDYIKVWQDRQ